jgi:hypothetical protein
MIPYILKPQFSSLDFKVATMLLSSMQLSSSILDFDLQFCVAHHKIFFSSLFVKIIELMKSMLQFELNLDPTIQNSSGFQFPICPISIV